MKENSEWLIVGIITSPYGVKGKMKIKSFSDFAERFTKPGKRWLQNDNETPIECELLSGFQKTGKDSFIITLKDINTRSQAESLRQKKLLVRSDDLPYLQNEEFHLSELINLKVNLIKSNKLQLIGEVCDLITENNNLLVIELYENNKKVLIPFVKEIVPTIDLQKKLIIINPPEGLLEL